MDTKEKLISVYTASTPGQADVARMALEDAGIRAAVTNDSLHGVHGFATVGAHALPSVLVAEQDVDAAKEVLDGLTKDPGFLSFDMKIMRGGGDSTTESRSARPLEAWPVCPECQKPRVTICPICATAGSSFPLADENFTLEDETPVVGIENADTESVLAEQRLAVICTTCDEPWLARFLRRCEWCGHDFGAGLKVDHVSRPAREPAEPMNPRVVILSAVMLGGMVALLAWFWLVTRR